MKIAQIFNPKPSYLDYEIFTADLINAGFKGDIENSYAQRLIFATDNSIYQRLPQAIIYPKDDADVVRIMQIIGNHPKVSITARGGGTGTNGQSLTTGVVVDLSRYFNKILEINPEQKWVRVQTGVVKDQLNAALKPYGLFFAPELSTSNRATIGGMINTDASGQGSCTYGKTRDHVLELDVVLLGGEMHNSRAINHQQLNDICQQNNKIAQIYASSYQIARNQADLIKQKFPKLNRCLTGYDLAHLLQENTFNLNSLLCGSEGTLGIITSAKLNLLPIPKFATLVNIRYSSFMDALHDAKALMQHHPLSIETVDSKVLDLAMQDFIWHSVEQYFPSSANIQTKGINLVEFCDDDETKLAQKVSSFIEHLQQDQSVTRLGHTLAIGNDAVKTVYGMRKRAVGLLGNVQGEARPQPFVEDTAVPPENLAAYIAEFRELLDSYQLEYGMFGHVDAGVLHVRPALDMKDPKQAALIRPISDAVANLTAKYHGLLWGEHGKGIRSEYAPKFFGELYPYLQQIKAIFDPHNQLNPGKIATPPNAEYQLLKIDEIPTRGELDNQIAPHIWQSFGASMHCNGNGACYNFDPNDAMCPTFKATAQRLQSPKGRTSIIREWLRLQNIAGVDVLQINTNENWFKNLFKVSATKYADDFSHQVYETLISCTSCKSCVGQCPIKVNIPELRSRFLQLYHSRYKRPIRDYLIAYLEFMLPILAKFPKLYNLTTNNKIIQKITRQTVGLVDAPALHPLFKLENLNIELADYEHLHNLNKLQQKQSIIIVQDVFTRYFDTQPLISLIDLVRKLGFTPYLMPLLPNGKPLQVLGFLNKFQQTAINTAKHLKIFHNLGINLVGLDPAMTLVYRQEYLKNAKINNMPKVLMPQEWLSSLQLKPMLNHHTNPNYILLPHCTEKTNEPNSSKQWQKVFHDIGLNLEIANVGCCGMAGTYGHESRNLATSRKIYALSWQKQLQKNATTQLLSTGYSCRSQVKRFDNKQLQHPVQILEQLL